MGAWGPKSFENDGALDWVAEVTELENFSGVAGALEAVMADKADYLDADVCEEGLAAAEIVAAAAGKPAAEMPEELAGWIKGQAKPDAAMVARAIDVLGAVREKSELRELWEESENFADWNAALDELKARLEAARAGRG
jgi:hypothetical protein